jgi:hypothetical protein
MASYTGTMVFYDSFIEALGDGTIDLDTDTFKVALFTSTHTPSVANTVYSGLTNEVANANGYTTAGEALTSVTWAQTGGAATFDAADTFWTASGGSIVARYYVLYSVTATGNDLVCYGLIDNSPADVTTTTGNTLTLTWNASGIFTGSMSDA